ncbi:hypothetical protein QOZ80_4BG0354720 [Eleusine coracana subsp. coracana]|nr:hypothetical protein QOZ80_4BG0354720 [Eleusine coracana subsp. coracana]
MEKGKKVSRGYVPWDDEMDKVLLDIFVEHYKKGDRCQNGWKPHVYTAAIKNVPKGYRNKVIRYWDSISLAYCKDQATRKGGGTASESSKEMAKEDGNKKDQAGYTTTSGSSLKRQRSDDSFTSAWLERIDDLQAPKLPSSAKVLAALSKVDGLDEDTVLDLYDILIADARKFESMMALPAKMRKRWLLKQLKK